MGLWEVALRASYDYPFIEMSRALPGTPISMWCIWNRELLQVPSRDPAVLRTAEESIRRAGHVIEQWTDGAASRLFLLECSCSRHDSLWNVFDAHQCWDAPPVVYQEGWAHFRVLSFEESKTRSLYDDLRRRGPAELVRKRELPLSVLPTSVWTDSLFGGLTPRQSEAVLTAHRFGYYQSPRPTTTAEIAQSLGLGRTTYEEHLRKAENRLLSTLVPYLQLFSTADRPPESAPAAGPPAPPSSGAGRSRRPARAR